MHQRRGSERRSEDASEPGESTPRSRESERFSEASPRKRVLSVFTLCCSLVFSVVYFAKLDLHWPYWLMLVQMVVELLFQDDLAPVMSIHHVANLGAPPRGGRAASDLCALDASRALPPPAASSSTPVAARPPSPQPKPTPRTATPGVTVMYLIWPTFDPIIREGLGVEVATFILSVHNVLGRRSNAMIKLAFAAAFFYTRFWIGGIRLADPHFVRASIDGERHTQARDSAKQTRAE